MVRRETYTDAYGKFTISLDPNSTNKTNQDASQGGGTGEFGASMGGWKSTTTRTVLWGCEIRASILDYTSSTVSLEGKDFSTPVDIGSIILRRNNSASQGNSISVTSMAAPDTARKEFDKGRSELSKKRLDKAEKHLLKATEIYPKYAAAWDLLGRTQRVQRQDDDAEKSFLAAIKADDKYVSPYLQLATLNAGRAKWPEVLSLTDKIVSLDGSGHPDAYFLNAIAHYNLKQMADAERSARKAVQTDKEHRFPRAELLLGNILRSKGEDADAADHLRTYVKLEPSSPEVPKIQIFLAKVGPSASSKTTKQD
jgi:tetratricopeptide (TPR) repeat protein